MVNAKVLNYRNLMWSLCQCPGWCFSREVELDECREQEAKQVVDSDVWELCHLAEPSNGLDE